MRESDVKLALVRYLSGLYGDDPDLLLVEEVCLNRGRTRADLVAVNGRLIGFEIKSQLDNLSRLSRQLRDYRTIFDEVNLVIGLKHLTGVLSEIPDWCGVMLASRVAGDVTVERFRPARENLQRDRHALAQLLWRAEALSVLERHGCARGVRSKNRATIWKRLAESLSTEQLTAEVRDALKNRPRRWRKNLRPKPVVLKPRSGL